MATATEIANLLGEACAAWSLDAAEVAARAGIAESEVADALRGEADVSDLDAVARALGGSLDDLLAGRPFWTAPAVALKSAPSGVELSLLRATLLRLSSAARDRAWLAGLLGRPTTSAVASVSFAPTPVSADVPGQAEQLAGEVRRHIGNELEPIASVRAVLRRLGVASFLSDFATDAIDGLLWRDAGGVACAAANVRARRGKPTAMRMSFAHELCHLLFDGTKLEPLGVVEKRTELGESREQRANAFAAYFLVPRVALQTFLDERGLAPGSGPTSVHLRAVSAHFAMGVEAVALHFVNCGYWNRQDLLRYARVATPDSRGPDTTELYAVDATSIVPLERRGEVLELATLALERNEITAARWRELLGLGAHDDWRRVAQEGEVSLDVEHRAIL